MVGIGLNSANALYAPERKLRKYLQGGKIEQSGEWHFVYDKDGQLTEKYKGSSKVVGHYPSQTRYERKDTGGGVQ